MRSIRMLAMLLLLALPALAHEGEGPPRALLQKIFPAADAFVTKKLDLTGDVRATIEKRLGAKLEDHDLDAPCYVATQKGRSIGAAWMTDVHLKGSFFLTQALLPLIADGGRILNVSSGLARFSLPGYAAYAAMKGGVEVLTRYLALELGPRRITVNTVAPGAIETDFGGGAVRDNAQLNALIAGQTALGRVGRPDDIGPVMAALLSDGLGWVNGQRIEASGGIHL